MTNFAIEGLISGFNTTELIESILDIQARAPVKQLESRIETYTLELASFQAVNASVLGLGVAGESLGSVGLFNGKQAASSDESIVTVSASSSASTGSFTIQVENLAQVEQISSDIYSNPTDELGLTGEFIVNGQLLSVTETDTLTSIASKINGSSTNANASVLQISSNQYKLLVSAASAGVNQLEMREVGTDGVLESLGLITSDVDYDHTVNANSYGAIGDLFTVGQTFDYDAGGETFTIYDAGGQYSVDVTLAGAGKTLYDIRDEINAAAAGTNIHAYVDTSDASGDERLLITSDTGIPTQFDDPDSVLTNLGVLSGIQSEELSSSVLSVGDLMGLGETSESTFQLTNGDSSFSIDVTVDLDSDSLEDIADAINDAVTASAGSSDISAQVITVGGASRLEISSDSGVPLFTSDPDNVLKTLGIVDNLFKNVDQQGENSQFKYNGVTVNRQTNLITDLRDGVSLALVNESSSVVNISIEEDLSQVTSVVEDFVSAFNSLAELIADQTYYDPEGEENGILFGNSTIRRLESALSSTISRSILTMPSVKVEELNDGAGIDFGSIVITDRSGVSATIDLSNVETIQDVLDEINYNTDVSVRAEINAGGRSINIIDESGGTGQFKIEEYGSGTTAKDLGIKSAIYGDQIAGSIISEGGASSLASIGISLSTAGTLTYNSTDFQAALNENPELVKNIFTAADIGFSDYLSDTLDTFTAYNTGILDVTTDGIQDRIDSLNEQIERYEDRAAAMEATLRQRFTAMEVALSESQQISDYLTQELAAG